MAKALASGFNLSEGNFGNLDEICQLLEEANKEDAIWQLAFKNCKKEDIHSWTMKVFSDRWTLPDIRIYMITEESTRRFVGWTALQFPWIDHPLKEEELAIVNSDDMPRIESMNMEVLQTYNEHLTFAKEHGYEPQTDYRKKRFSRLHVPVNNIWADRKGTMIHPDFQRRGFGTFLTHHCNAIADKTGGKTWVTARPTSVKMFKQCGFKDVAAHNADLGRWGGNTEEEISWLLVREALN